MNKIILRHIVTQSTYAWFYHKPSHLVQMYGMHLVHDVGEHSDTVYDIDKRKLTTVFKHGEVKLTCVFSKDAEGQRVVRFPQLGKQEVFKQRTKRETVAAYVLHEALLHFGLK